MRLTVRRAWTAFLVLFALSATFAAAAPSAGSGELHASDALAARADTARRIGLYSPHVRRSTVMYLRLRLLELREEGLDRARGVIERRLGIDELLAEPAHPTQKATEHPRRTVWP